MISEKKIHVILIGPAIISILVLSFFYIKDNIQSTKYTDISIIKKGDLKWR